MGFRRLEDWIWNQLSSFMDCFGEQVSSEQEEERKRECDGCKYNGRVKPETLLPEVDGCTKCGCPFMTKRRQKKYLRMKGKKNHPLTKEEIAQISLYKDTDEVEIITIECPHEEGNKWADIDKKY